MSHAVLAPSAAERWVPCPGSVTMEARYPEYEDGETAKEGTAAHDVAFRLVTTGTMPEVGAFHPNGVQVTEEMHDGAKLYAEALRAHGLDGWRLETPVACPSVHAQCWGTPDARKFIAATGHLILPDYKFGHRYVDPFENWQLMCYASGSLDELGVDGRQDEHIVVDFQIIQPRNYDSSPVRTWSVRASDLRGHFNTLRMSAEKALGDNPECKAGLHCRDCLARHACPALQRSGMAWAQESRRALPAEMNAAAVGLELDIVTRAIKELEARAAGLEEQALRLATTGHNVPGWRIARGQGRERWTKPYAEIKALGELYGVPLVKDALITPNQARAAKLDPEVVKLYSETPAGGLKLVPMGNFTRRVFFQI